MADVKLRMTMDASQVKKGTNEAKSNIKGFSQDVKSGLASSIGKFAAVGGAIAGAAVIAKKAWQEFNQAVNDGAALVDMSKRLDMTTEAVQRYSYAAKKAASDIDTIAGTSERLKRQMFDASEGNEKLTSALLRLGVSMDTIKNQDIDKAFQQIGDALNNSAPSAQRTKDLYDVLGKSSGTLILFLKELRENSEKAINFKVSESDIAALKRAEEAFSDVELKIKSMKMTLAGGLIQFTEFAYKISALKDVVEGLSTLHQLGTRRYTGTDEQNQQMRDKEAAYEAAKARKENEKTLAETKAADAAKKTAEEKQKLADEEQKQKSRILEQVQKTRDEQEKLNMTDKERIAYLDEIYRKGQAQYEAAKAAGKVGVNDMEALKMAEDARLERMRLANQMDKAAEAKKPKLDIATDSAVGIGNFLGSNLNNRMLSIGEETNKLLNIIEQNTRPRNAMSPNIFTQ